MPGRADDHPQHAEQLSNLTARYRLAPDSVSRLLCLIELIGRDPNAPTTVREPAAAVDVHLADSLTGLELDVIRGARRIADLGAGAGFPGLPLAIALPEAEVSLIESNGRKCMFLKRAVDAGAARNASVVNVRAEDWVEGLGRCDIVTARALASPAVVAEYAAPLLRVGGTLVAWRGRRDAAAERCGERAAAELGLRVEPPARVHPYAGAEHRYLHLMTKIEETPGRFPRRPGVALKRPLGRRASDRTRR
jgi:16S rRNA (guanine527-N7)-methyltransferase